MSTLETQTNPPLRDTRAQLVDGLKAGRVYRREDLTLLSNAVDRHVRELVSLGRL
jgi:hypothetical protein